jgi:hypothetical protein
MWRAPLAMALTRPMNAPTMGEPVSIMESIMVVRLTGIAVPGTPMARGAARQPGTMARVAPQDGVVAALHGTMDREISAVSEAAPPRGVAVRGAQGDGEAARSPGAVVVFTVADSGDEAACSRAMFRGAGTIAIWRLAEAGSEILGSWKSSSSIFLVSGRYSA